MNKLLLNTLDDHFKLKYMIIDSNTGQELIKLYIGVIPEKYFDLIQDLTLGLRKLADIPDDEISEWKHRKLQREQEYKLLSETVYRNNLGIIAEKRDNLDEAIGLYEQNIKEGYPATHSFERLMIIYRKTKRYSDEIRVIDRAIAVFNRDNNDLIAKWLNRKQKTITLLQTQNE